ncbi:hypothetical protein M1D48_13770 [Erwinia sp. D4-22]
MSLISASILATNEGKLEVARSLLEMGMPRESVLKATGLTEDDLAQLRH